MADLKDLLNYSHEQKPIEFQSAVSELLAAKLADAVASRKQQLALSLFDNSEPSTDSDDTLDIDDNDQDEINNDNDPDNQDENSEE